MIKRQLLGFILLAFTNPLFPIGALKVQTAASQTLKSDTVKLTYNRCDTIIQLTNRPNCSIEKYPAWLTATVTEDKKLTISVSEHYNHLEPRTAKIILRDSNNSREIVIWQQANRSVDRITAENAEELRKELAHYFNDPLCTNLYPGINRGHLETVTNDYARLLVHNALSGMYTTRYRVGTFEPYQTIDSLKKELKTSGYDPYENPTGIYFTKGEKLVLFVQGIGQTPVSLIIKSFGKEQYKGEKYPESSYLLKNGINVIEAKNRGNGYISYYTDSYQKAPKVKIHFAQACESGYFDIRRGDSNRDWEELLATAKSDIIDIITPRIHVAAPIETLQKDCPKEGLRLARIYDDVVRLEHEIMGLILFNREPKNHQFARPVEGGIYADNIGAAIWHDGFSSWANPDKFGYWGFAHELGHVNQVRPGLKWGGTGEVTNNIYSAWVNFNMDNLPNLEKRLGGINEYKKLNGGRFQCYLEEGVRQGKNWMTQEGPDYFNSKLQDRTVQDEDYNGKKTGEVTIPWKNYDHFVRVVPMWQLLLYTQAADKSENAYGKVIEGIRNYPNEEKLTNGQLQIKFMRSFCDSTQINFLPFFEQAGMLKPYNHYFRDYGDFWIKISQEMIDELKAYIAAKGYPEADKMINYINCYNWQVFRDGAKLQTNKVNAGCTRHDNLVRIENDAWRNVVGYETYNSHGKLLRISMLGLGNTEPGKTQTYTEVLWPEGAAYIMAVGYDGQRVKCFKK